MPLQFIKSDTAIDFIGRKKVAFIVSAVLILVGIVSLVVKGGPDYGIDFAGGITVQIQFDEEVDINEVKAALADANIPDLAVQRFGMEGEHSYLLRIPVAELSAETIRERVQSGLEDDFQTGFAIQSTEMVGPKVGADLRSQALEALFYAVLIIAIYISGRFEQRWFAAAIMAAGLATGIYVLKLVHMPIAVLILAALVITVGLCWYLKLNYALGAVAALIHDLMITVGIFSLLNKEFSLTIVAALLTIIGYSLNDTIIVFDRIRENLKGKARSSRTALPGIINRSINQTLSRTLLTSGTTLVVVGCLYLFGGGVINDFALALLIGILVGTYSSIFVASPILIGFGVSPPESEEKAAATAS
ncbi:MAG: protein translocase subunit SecF [Desulfohalobiaceae bacterium]